VTKKLGRPTRANQPVVSFVVLLHGVPAKLLAQAAQRRAMTVESLIEGIASGVVVRGCIERQLEHWHDWQIEKRTMALGKKRRLLEQLAEV
jgi:hypothetical protein